MFDCVTSNNLLEVFPTFECCHRCDLKYSVELDAYLQDIPVSITILDTLESVLLYIVDSGVLFLSFFSLLVNSSFLSILSTCSSRTSPLYCRPWNFCLTIAQFLSNSVVVEQIAFSLETWPYGMLLFRDLACYDLAWRMLVDV